MLFYFLVTKVQFEFWYFDGKRYPIPWKLWQRSYTGTETLDRMRLFGDAVQSNQVCTFRSLVVCLIGHTGMD